MIVLSKTKWDRKFKILHFSLCNQGLCYINISNSLIDNNIFLKTLPFFKTCSNFMLLNIATWLLSTTFVYNELTELAITKWRVFPWPSIVTFPPPSTSIFGNSTHLAALIANVFIAEPQLNVNLPPPDMY